MRMGLSCLLALAGALSCVSCGGSSGGSGGGVHSHSIVVLSARDEGARAAAGDLGVILGSGPSLQAGDNVIDDVMRFNLAFGTGVVPTGARVTNARIVLVRYLVIGTPAPFGRLVVDHFVPEFDNRFSDRDFDGGNLQRGFTELAPPLAGPISGERPFFATVTDQLQADIDAGRPLSAFRVRYEGLLSDFDGSSDGLLFYGSGTLIDADAYPRLEVTYED
ncbi:MAG: hypothetical protein AB7T63_05145 [Planctomycetota bacterium]